MCCLRIWVQPILLSQRTTGTVLVLSFNGRLCEIVAGGDVIEFNVSTVDLYIRLSLDDILLFAIKEPSSLKKLLG